MNQVDEVWLVTNAASGSNDEATVAALQQACIAGAIRIAGHSRFPDEPLPSAATLEAEGIGHVAVFAGDGTVHTLVTGLYGWAGAILVLPGGTMNFLSRRLHGEAGADAILARVASGQMRRTRPSVVRGRQGDSFSGSLAGPGTTWNKVREAIREADIAGIAGGAVEAISETLGAPAIRIVEPALGLPEGYPLVTLTPVDAGIELAAYRAESLGEFISQGWALLRRDFREGPHETFTVPSEVTLASVAGEEIGLLVDGEPFDAGAREQFCLARCEVDLIATQ